MAEYKIYDKTTVGQSLILIYANSLVVRKKKYFINWVYFTVITCRVTTKFTVDIFNLFL